MWNKVHTILKYLPDCKRLLWIDTDAVFVNMNKTLESFIQSRETHFVVSRTVTRKAFNAGVFLMQSTSIMREFFVNVTAAKSWSRPDWCWRFGFEQSAIVDVLNSGNMEGKFEINESLQSMCGKNNQCVPTDKDFILHLAPATCPGYHFLFQTLFKENPHFL